MHLSSQKQLSTALLACAFSNDARYCAVATVCGDIHIYHVPSACSTTDWVRVATISAHDDPVTALDWQHPRGLLLSCGEDRNVFVWVPPASLQTDKQIPQPQQDDAAWRSDTVNARLSLAALCASWAPSGEKFALGTVDRSLSICSYSSRGACYTSRLIRGAHDGPVTAVAWHPGGTLLASCSTDGTCRVFCAHLPGDSAPDSLSSTKFGQQLLCVDPQDGWVNHLTWAPSGQQLLCCTHGSSLDGAGALHCVLGAAATAEAAGSDDEPARLAPHQTIAATGLALRMLLPVSERQLIAADWGGKLHEFTCTSEGAQWHLPARGSSTDEVLQLAPVVSPLRELNGDMRSMRLDNLAIPVKPRTQEARVHSRCIVALHTVHNVQDSLQHCATRVASASMEGKLAFWELGHLA